MKRPLVLDVLRKKNTVGKNDQNKHQEVCSIVWAIVITKLSILHHTISATWKKQRGLFVFFYKHHSLGAESRQIKPYEFGLLSAEPKNKIFRAWCFSQQEPPCGEKLYSLLQLTKQMCCPWIGKIFTGVKSTQPYMYPPFTALRGKKM